MAASARGSPGRACAMWFRCDLRLDDNPALQAACSGASTLLPICVLDPSRFNVPTLAGAKKSSARRARFLLDSLAVLRRRLEQRGSGLVLAVGAPQEVLPRVCKGCSQVHITQTVCSEEQREEAKVAKRMHGTELKRSWGGTLYMPEDIGCRANDTPLLFTAFKNKAENRGCVREPLDPPQQLPPLPQPTEVQELKEGLSFMPTLESLGYAADEAAEALEDDPRGVMKFEGGEEAALQRVKSWMWDGDNLKDYFDIRNGMLGESYSSKLSPWMALGCISPRRVWKECQRYERQRVSNKSTYWLVFELTWRDFFIYMANSQGDRIFVPGGITGQRMPWRGGAEALESWKTGTTGDKLVDANMRELQATGWMSNRGRQNVASYLIFDLGVDWRYGAAHFEELLLDYDPCSNWGNWVAAAGLTGQRVNRFNTKKQLNDYDPERAYVRHWLDGSSEVPKRQTTLFQSGFQSSKGKGGGGKGGKGPSGSKGGKGKWDRHGADSGGSDQKKRRWERRGGYGGYEDTLAGA